MACPTFGCTTASIVVCAVALLAPTSVAGVAPWSLMDSWQTPAHQLRGDESNSSLIAAFQSFRQVAAHGSNQQQHFQRMRDLFNISFVALPKNSRGRLAPRGVRHILYNYFTKRHGWLFKGIEHHGNSRATKKGLHEVSIIQQKAPSLKKVMMEARLLEQGLSLDEVVHFALALESLVNDDFHTILQKAFKLSKLSTRKPLKLEDLRRALSMYVILITEPHAAKPMVNKGPGEPEWRNVAHFVEDAIQATLFAGRVTMNPFLAKPFSFEDAWRIAELIGKRMPRYQNEDCDDMKHVLVELDPAGHGRVALKGFYGERASKSGYGFVESRDYLRRIGALDETDPQDPRVLIANYVKGPSNCIVVTQHQLVCCLSECADLMIEVERRVAAPTATPEALVEIISSMSSASVKGPRELSPRLVKKMRSIGALHKGKVPLHGRLFAQWLHFAFPNECPYPQIIESTSGLNSPPLPVDKIGDKEKKRAVKKTRVKDQDFLFAWLDLEVLPLDNEMDIVEAKTSDSGILFKIMITGVVLIFAYCRSGVHKLMMLRLFKSRSLDEKYSPDWIIDCDVKSNGKDFRNKMRSLDKKQEDGLIAECEVKATSKEIKNKGRSLDKKHENGPMVECEVRATSKDIKSKNRHLEKKPDNGPIAEFDVKSTSKDIKTKSRHLDKKQENGSVAECEVKVTGKDIKTTMTPLHKKHVDSGAVDSGVKSTAKDSAVGERPWNTLPKARKIKAERDPPVQNACQQVDAEKEALREQALAKETVAKEVAAKEAAADEAVAKEAVAKETVAKEAVANEADAKEVATISHSKKRSPKIEELPTGQRSSSPAKDRVAIRPAVKEGEVAVGSPSSETATKKSACLPRSGHTHMTPSTSISSDTSDRQESECFDSESSSSHNNEVELLTKSKSSSACADEVVVKRESKVSAESAPNLTLNARATVATSIIGTEESNSRPQAAELTTPSSEKRLPPPPSSLPPPPPPPPPPSRAPAGGLRNPGPPPGLSDPGPPPGMDNPGPPPGLEMPSVPLPTQESLAGQADQPDAAAEASDVVSQTVRECHVRLPPGLESLGPIPMIVPMPSLGLFSSGRPPVGEESNTDPIFQRHDATDDVVHAPLGLDTTGDPTVLAAQMQDIAEELRRERMARKRLEGMLGERAIGRKIGSSI